MSRTAAPIQRDRSQDRDQQAPDGADRSGFELARDASRGDLSAARSLLEAVAPTMAQAVRSVVGPASPEVEDVVQEALIAFVQALPKFRGECRPSTYGARIAVRTALATRRRAHNARRKLDAYTEQRVQQPASPPTPTDHLQAADRREIIRNLLDRLPVEQAETLALGVVVGLSLRDVAAATNTRLNTVKSRLRLAKQALRAQIQADATLARELGVAP